MKITLFRRGWVFAYTYPNMNWCMMSQVWLKEFEVHTYFFESEFILCLWTIWTVWSSFVLVTDYIDQISPKQHWPNQLLRFYANWKIKWIKWPKYWAPLHSAMISRNDVVFNRSRMLHLRPLQGVGHHVPGTLPSWVGGQSQAKGENTHQLLWQNP